MNKLINTLRNLTQEQIVELLIDLEDIAVIRRIYMASSLLLMGREAINELQSEYSECKGWKEEDDERRTREYLADQKGL